MAFNPNIPVITDAILQSSAQIRSNFQQIAAAWVENHVSLTDEGEPGTPSDEQGKHTVLTLYKQAGDPTTSATQISLYNKLDSNSIPELFFRPSSNQTPIQLTYPSLSTVETGAPGGTQYSFVAGPFIVFGGYRTGITNGTPVTLTPGTNLRYVSLTLFNTGTFFPQPFATATNIVGNTFTFTANTSSPLDMYYLAIGQ